MIKNQVNSAKIKATSSSSSKSSRYVQPTKTPKKELATMAFLRSQTDKESPKDEFSVLTHEHEVDDRDLASADHRLAGFGVEHWRRRVQLSVVFHVMLVSPAIRNRFPHFQHLRMKFPRLTFPCSPREN